MELNENNKDGLALMVFYISGNIYVICSNMKVMNT